MFCDPGSVNVHLSDEFRLQQAERVTNLLQEQVKRALSAADDGASSVFGCLLGFAFSASASSASVESKKDVVSSFLLSCLPQSSVVVVVLVSWLLSFLRTR